jgi:hypothetical protein
MLANVLLPSQLPYLAMVQPSSSDQMQNQDQLASTANATLDDMQLKTEMERIKKDLKAKTRFESAAKRLIELIPKHLNFENKRLFYDALNIVSFRVGKPGFTPSIAKQLFDTAHDHKQHFSSGYRKNIEDWKRTVDEYVTSPESTSLTTERADGRFNSPRSRPNRQSVMNFANTIRGLPPEVLLRNMFGAYPTDSDSSDDESSSSSFSIPLPPHVHNNEKANQSFFANYYPFSNYTHDLPLVSPIKLPHHNDPQTFSVHFVLTAEQVAR